MGSESSNIFCCVILPYREEKNKKWGHIYVTVGLQPLCGGGSVNVWEDNCCAVLHNRQLPFRFENPALPMWKKILCPTDMAVSVSLSLLNNTFNEPLSR